MDFAICCHSVSPHTKKICQVTVFQSWATNGLTTGAVNRVLQDKMAWIRRVPFGSLHFGQFFVHFATVMKSSLPQRGIKTIAHLPYLPDLVPINFFLFPKVKSDLILKTLTLE